MGQQYSKEVLDYRKKSKKEAKKLGFLPNKKAVVHPLNQAPKQTKVLVRQFEKNCTKILINFIFLRILDQSNRLVSGKKMLKEVQ